MPASLGVQGPGDSTMASGSAAMTARCRHLVVAVHDDVRAQFTEIVHQVEGKAVVIVDQHDHGTAGYPCGYLDARRKGVKATSGRAASSGKDGRHAVRLVHFTAKNETNGGTP